MSINYETPDMSVKIWTILDEELTLAPQNYSNVEDVAQILAVRTELPFSECMVWADNYATQNLLFEGV